MCIDGTGKVDDRHTTYVFAVQFKVGGALHFTIHTCKPLSFKHAHVQRAMRLTVAHVDVGGTNVLYCVPGM